MRHHLLRILTALLAVVTILAALSTTGAAPFCAGGKLYEKSAAGLIPPVCRLTTEGRHRQGRSVRPLANTNRARADHAKGGQQLVAMFAKGICHNRGLCFGQQAI